MLGVYRKSENRKKAEAAVLRARELLKICELENSRSGATILINAATTMKAFGNPSAAKELYETAEKIYTDSGVPKDDPLIAALYNNYATTLTELCEFEKAERLYLLAREITEKSISTLPDCAVTLVNMAHLYEDWEGTESEKIEICLTRAEKILLGNDAEENSYLAFVLSKCAPSFEYFGFFIAAKEMNKKSRRLYEGA